MQIGAMVASQPEGVLNMLKSIGEPAGIAFQIVDDILDMTADEKVFGKKKFGDLYEGKLTLIMLHAYKNASDAEKKRIDSIYKKKRDEKSEDEIQFLNETAIKYGSIDYARSIAVEYGNKAKSQLETYTGLVPENEYGVIMRSAIEDLFKRQK